MFVTQFFEKILMIYVLIFQLGMVWLPAALMIKPLGLIVIDCLLLVKSSCIYPMFDDIVILYVLSIFTEYPFSNKDTTKPIFDLFHIMTMRCDWSHTDW